MQKYKLNEATIVKFCRYLGYKGYKEFRVEFIKDFMLKSNISAGAGPYPGDIRNYILRECAAGAGNGNFGLCLEGIRGVPLEKVRIARDAIAKFNGGTVPALEKIDGI